MFDSGGVVRIHALGFGGNVDASTSGLSASTQYTIQLRWDRVDDVAPDLYYRGGGFGTAFIFLDTLNINGTFPREDWGWAFNVNAAGALTTTRTQEYRILSPGAPAGSTFNKWISMGMG